MPTTPNGTVYTVTAFTAGGNSAWRAVADSVVGGQDIPLLLFCHGNPGTVLTSADQQFAAGYATQRNWLIDNGWAYVEGHGAGANWGNQAGRDAYEAMFSATAAVWDIGKVIVLGRSMGALVGAWLASQSPVVSPRCAGFVSLSGTADLSNRYSTAGASDRTNLEAAYGVTGETAFRAAAAAFDPLLVSTSTWDDRNALMQWDTSDTTVPYAINGQAWDVKYGPSLAIRRTHVTSGGDHNTTPNDAGQVAATIAFFQDAELPEGIWSDTWSDTWGTQNVDASGSLTATVSVSGVATANVTRTAAVSLVAAIQATPSGDTVRAAGLSLSIALSGDLANGTINRTASITLAIGAGGVSAVDMSRSATVALACVILGAVSTDTRRTADVGVALGVAGVVATEPSTFPDVLTLTVSLPLYTLEATVPQLTLEASW